VTKKGKFVSTGKIVSRIFRPSKAPVAAPFGLRSAGHIDLSPGEWRGSGETQIFFAMLYWITKGSGFIRVDGKEYPLKKDFVAFYNFGAHSKIFTKDSSMKYRFLTLDGPAASVIMKGLKLEGPPQKAFPCPEEAFEDFSESLRKQGPRAELETSFRLYGFLTELSAELNNKIKTGDNETFSEKAIAILNAHAYTPDGGVAQAADEMQLERSVFSRRFKEATGIPPKEHIDQMRLQKALSLLLDKQMPVKEVSEACGFSAPGYMAKFFKKKMGVSPSEFRAQGDSLGS
jgi:AraC-like DNA-binding protein